MPEDGVVKAPLLDADGAPIEVFGVVDCTGFTSGGFCADGGKARDPLVSTVERGLVIFLRGAVAAAAGRVGVAVAVVVVPQGAVVARVALEEEAGRGEVAL
jgi:hypothetical protein